MATTTTYLYKTPQEKLNHECSSALDIKLNVSMHIPGDDVLLNLKNRYRKYTLDSINVWKTLSMVVQPLLIAVYM